MFLVLFKGTIWCFFKRLVLLFSFRCSLTFSEAVRWGNLYWSHLLGTLTSSRTRGPTQTLISGRKIRLIIKYKLKITRRLSPPLTDHQELFCYRHPFLFLSLSLLFVWTHLFAGFLLASRPRHHTDVSYVIKLWRCLYSFNHWASFTVMESRRSAAETSLLDVCSWWSLSIRNLQEKTRAAQTDQSQLVRRR